MDEYVNEICCNLQEHNNNSHKKEHNNNIVRTNFDLNPEREWTQAQEIRTINL